MDRLDNPDFLKDVELKDIPSKYWMPVPSRKGLAYCHRLQTRIEIERVHRLAARCSNEVGDQKKDLQDINRKINILTGVTVGVLVALIALILL